MRQHNIHGYPYPRQAWYFNRFWYPLMTIMGVNINATSRDAAFATLCSEAASAHQNQMAALFQKRL